MRGPAVIFDEVQIAILSIDILILELVLWISRIIRSHVFADRVADAARIFGHGVNTNISTQA